MNGRLSRTRLAAIQKDLWLAEIARETTDSLLVTLAGDGRVLAFDFQDLLGLALAQESLDPWVLPEELEILRPLEIGDGVEFEPEEEIAARLHELSEEQLADLLAAARIDWSVGSAEALRAAPWLFDLRVENWGPDEARCDLHLLIAARGFLAVDDDEIDLSPRGDERLRADAGEARPHQAPAEPAWAVLPHDLPAELEAPLERFFRAQQADDWVALAEVWPALDLDRDQQLVHLERHFHALEDWGHARLVEDWKTAGELAAVRIRGISHSAPEIGLEALNEECVWTFSLRRRAGGYVIRGWSRGWPSVGGAASLTTAERPWLEDWRSGPILDD
ncbi:MAG: hypothetical protein H6807_04510 [Planctomycetes bacterium]|nr:hypothetical protein [Planctomycetota bacterium]